MTTIEILSNITILLFGIWASSMLGLAVLGDKWYEKLFISYPVVLAILIILVGPDRLLEFLLDFMNTKLW